MSRPSGGHSSLHHQSQLWRDRLRASFPGPGLGGEPQVMALGRGESSGRVSGLFLFLFCGCPTTANFPGVAGPASVPWPRPGFLLRAQQARAEPLAPTELRRACDVDFLKYPPCLCYLSFSLCPGIPTLGPCSSCLSLPAWPQPVPGTPALGLSRPRAGRQLYPAGGFSSGGLGSLGVTAAKGRSPYFQGTCFACAGRRPFSKRLRSLFLALGEIMLPRGGAALAKLLAVLLRSICAGPEPSLRGPQPLGEEASVVQLWHEINYL